MLSEQEIERIVQEVIRRLTSAGHTIGDGSPRQLQVEDRVVSLATIAGKLDGIQQLIVQAKTVITPSVRDELRQKRIQLVRQA